MIKLDGVDTTQLEMRLRALNKVVKKDLGSMIRQEARLLAVELARVTTPYGKSKSAKERGEAAVRRDIYKVYHTTGTAWGKIKAQEDKRLADIFWFAIKQRKYAAARKILASVGLDLKAFDKGVAHREKFTGGKVRGESRFVSRSDRTLKTYANKIAKRVGYAKSGWARCAMLLGGTRGIPAWVTRHAKKGYAPGYVVDRTRGARPYIILENRVPFIGRVLNRGTVSRAVKWRMQMLVKRMEKAKRAMVRKAGLKR